MQTIYRDTKTGRFAKKSNWRKAKRRGSKRFKREYVRRKPKRDVTPRPPRQPLKTFFAVFTYVNARGKRQFDFFVKTVDRSRVEGYIKKFVKGHPKFEVDLVGNIFTRLASFGMTREIAEIPPEEFNEFYDKPEGFVSYQ
jgi:hypothetical protein